MFGPRFTVDVYWELQEMNARVPCHYRVPAFLFFGYPLDHVGNHVGLLLLLDKSLQIMQWRCVANKSLKLVRCDYLLQLVIDQ